MPSSIVHSAESLANICETKRPVVPTAEWRKAAELRDIGACQELLDFVAEASAEEGIRQGLTELAAGKTQPASEALEEFRTRHGVER